MAKFYKSAEFKQLQTEWRQKLVDENFEDHENEREILKQYNRRTQAWDDRDIILDQSLRLECYLTLNGDQMNPKYRLICELYLKGVYKTQIAREVGFHRNWVMQVITKYLKIVE